MIKILLMMNMLIYILLNIKKVPVTGTFFKCYLRLFSSSKDKLVISAIKLISIFFYNKALAISNFVSSWVICYFFSKKGP